MCLHHSKHCLQALLAVLACLLVSASRAEGPVYSPDRLVALDIPWLSPPVITPADSASSRVANQAARLEATSPTDGGSFVWRLRYPVDTSRWPIFVFRYRASNLVAGPLYGEQVVQLDVRTAMPSAQRRLFTVRDLVQDGALHELRADLSRDPSGGRVEAVRFTFHPAAGKTGQLDIAGMQFEQPAAAAQPLAVQTVSFAVRDEAGQPVSGAEVRAGILERANWTTVGRTGADGNVSLTTIVPPGDAAGAAAPIEAAVLGDGYLTGYVAQIPLPHHSAVAVALRKVPETTAATPATPAAPEPPATPATPRPYVPADYSNYYDNGGYYTSTYYSDSYYDSGWWVPWYSWPNTFGTFIVFVSPSHDHFDCDDARFFGHSRHGDSHRDGSFHRDGGFHRDGWQQNRGGAGSPDFARGNDRRMSGSFARGGTGSALRPFSSLDPATPSGGNRAGDPGQFRTVPSVGVSTGLSSPVVTAPRTGVRTAPSSPIVTAPSTGVRTAPSAAVVTAPGTGINTAPSSAVVTAPNTGVRTGPSAAVNAAPASGIRTAPSSSSAGSIRTANRSAPMAVTPSGGSDRLAIASQPRSYASPPVGRSGSGSIGVRRSAEGRSAPALAAPRSFSPSSSFRSSPGGTVRSAPSAPQFRGNAGVGMQMRSSAAAMPRGPAASFGGRSSGGFAGGGRGSGRR